MAKFSIAVVLVAVISKGSALPLVESDGDIARAAYAGDWDRVHQLIQNEYVSGRVQQGRAIPTSVYGYKMPLQDATGASAKASGNAAPGGRYFSQSEYTYSRQSNNNGDIKKDEGGLGVIDNNGQVTYYTPKSIPLPNPASYSAPQGWNSGYTNQGISPYGR